VKPIRLSAEADVELVETAGFYDERQVGLGAAFLSEFLKTTKLVQQFPASGRPIGHRMRRVLTNRFPYAVIYLEYRDEILVVAIAHTSRRPGYWRSRMTGDPRFPNR
jgi:plasmid stabilization system protein ParE